ncbi:MAG: hypothetical protein D3910_28970, partial [Candidatus Electrothrix sp. ATG2]|nr:hypothetical protein [Candidatus Electrothrix sp. ATG2]
YSARQDITFFYVIQGLCSYGDHRHYEQKNQHAADRTFLHSFSNELSKAIYLIKTTHVKDVFIMPIFFVQNSFADFFNKKGCRVVSMFI